MVTDGCVHDIDLRRQTNQLTNRTIHVAKANMETATASSLPSGGSPVSAVSPTSSVLALRMYAACPCPILSSCWRWLSMPLDGTKFCLRIRSVSSPRDVRAPPTHRSEFFPSRLQEHRFLIFTFFSLSNMYLDVQQGAANASIPTTSPVIRSTLKVPSPTSATSNRSMSAAKQTSTHNAAPRGGSLNSLVVIPASLVILLASCVYL